MKTKTGILQLFKSTLLLALFVSCTHENSELGVEKNNNNRNAQALVSKKLIIDNSENEFNLSFKLIAFMDTNQLGTINPNLSFQNYEVNVRPHATTYFTDFSSIFNQYAGNDLWYKYDSNGFTGSILSGDDANASGGTFANGVDDTNGYFAHWADIKGTVSGLVNLDGMDYNFNATYKFVLSPLAGGLIDAQSGLIETEILDDNGNTVGNVTILTYLTQDMTTGDITVKFKYVTP
jgi:hypothetical protein